MLLYISRGEAQVPVNMFFLMLPHPSFQLTEVPLHDSMPSLLNRNWASIVDKTLEEVLQIKGIVLSKKTINMNYLTCTYFIVLFVYI